MAFKLKSIKQKKALIIAGIPLAAIGIVGTIAYNMDSISFANLFKTKDSVEEYVETFESPSNWQPCQEIDKTAVATNRNDTVRYARMKIDKYWRLDPSQISDPDDHTTSELSLTWDDNGTTKEYGIINTQNDNDWELRSDGWYYYKTPLQKNQSTNSLLKSVTLNCDANLVTDGTAVATQTGQEGESVPTAYAGSKFHVYVTMQLSDEDWPIQQHTADCDSNILYDTIACQTNGIDDGSDENHNFVNFTQTASSATGNGNGVNTLAAHANDEYPVYYFRGEVDNNFVVWNNMCWRAFRTTGTGGVKMQYWGDAQVSNGAVTCGDNEASGISTSMANSGSTTFSSVGYVLDYTIHFDSTQRAFGSETTIMSNDVSYDSDTGIYTLDMNEGQYIQGAWSDANFYNASKERYHYWCRGGATSCSNDDLFYIYGYYGVGQNAYALRFYSTARPAAAADINELKEVIFANNNGTSPMKGDIESWFTTNNLVASDLEDTIFCNDRTFTEGALAGKDSAGVNITIGDTSDFDGFAGFTRNFVVKNGNYRPSIDCARGEDSFTVNVANGNGLLQYPVGAITADEVTLAGRKSGCDNPNESGFTKCTLLSSSANELTMTPWNAYHDMMYIARYYNGFWNGYASATYGNVHPVVSLKGGSTYVTGGDGAKINPYVIE